MKKLLALVLALVMTLSLCTISNAAFTDAKDVDASYEEAVAVLNGMGVFKGYEDGSFKPEGSITRAEVAAIVYRLYTGDVKDKQAGLYAGYGKFDDMAGAAWAAGYVGFCANAGFVKGYGNGKFGPSDPVTGYQALAMILRAVGYGKNGEFEGADWELHVAQIAQQLKVLKNVKGVSLKAAASRELVAELLFQVAAYVDTVEYTPAFGYVANTVVTAKAETLGEKNFNLTKSADGADNWGRPQYKWFSDDNGNKKVDTKETKYATIQAKPEATYTTAVTECQIAADVDLKDIKEYTLYTNGVVNATKYKVQPTDTVQKLGAQGTLTEVYEDCIVVIDTFLAKVTDVKAAAYDAAGHLKADSRIDLKVYATDTDVVENGTAMYLTNGTTDYTYAKGDMVLVNAYTHNNVNYTTGDVTVDDPAVTYNQLAVTNGVTNNKAVYAEILGVAESMVGAQTFLWYNALQHTVEGENYNDAKWFKLDQAGTDVAKHTWFFDSYGNLIGVVDIATQYSFGIVENIQWQNPALAVGYAQATIRYVDATTETKVVTAIDGKTLTYAIGNNDGDFSNGYISTTMQNNLSQCGDHLYRIATAADGTISLNHVFVDADNDGVQDSGEADSEIQTADVKTGISAITNSTATVYTNSNTQYLIRTDVKNANGVVTGYTYATVTGYENIGNYTGDDVVVDYVNLNNDSYVDYVYITGTADSASAWGLFFPTSATIQTVLKTTGTVDHYLVTGYADGAAATVKVNPVNTNGSFGTDVTAAELASMVNKMYVVHYTNGVIDQIWGNKTDVADLHNEICSGANAAYAGTALEYYAGTGETVTYDGFALKVGSAAPINVVGVTPVVGEWAADLSNKVIHVVYNKTTTKALQVYITDVADSGQNSGNGTPATPSTLTLAQNGAKVEATYTNNTDATQSVKVVYQYKVAGATGGYATYTTGTATFAAGATDTYSGEALTLPTGGFQMYEVLATVYVNGVATAITASANFMN